MAEYIEMQILPSTSCRRLQEAGTVEERIQVFRCFMDEARHRPRRDRTRQRHEHQQLQIRALREESHLHIREVSRNLGLSSDELDRLRSNTFVENSPRKKQWTNCTICLEDFKEKQKIWGLPCTHEFHSPCAGHWLQKNRLCPICRKDPTVQLETQL